MKCAIVFLTVGFYLCCALVVASDAESDISQEVEALQKKVVAAENLTKQLTTQLMQLDREISAVKDKAGALRPESPEQDKAYFESRIAELEKEIGVLRNKRHQAETDRTAAQNNLDAGMEKAAAAGVACAEKYMERKKLVEYVEKKAQEHSQADNQLFSGGTAYFFYDKADKKGEFARKAFVKEVYALEKVDDYSLQMAYEKAIQGSRTMKEEEIVALQAGERARMKAVAQGLAEEQAKKKAESAAARAKKAYAKAAAAGGGRRLIYVYAICNGYSPKDALYYALNVGKKGYKEKEIEITRHDGKVATRAMGEMGVSFLEKKRLSNLNRRAKLAQSMASSVTPEFIAAARDDIKAKQIAYNAASASAEAAARKKLKSSIEKYEAACVAIGMVEGGDLPYLFRNANIIIKLRYHVEPGFFAEGYRTHEDVITSLNSLGIAFPEGTSARYDAESETLTWEYWKYGHISLEHALHLYRERK